MNDDNNVFKIEIVDEDVDIVTLRLNVSGVDTFTQVERNKKTGSNRVLRRLYVVK